MKQPRVLALDFDGVLWDSVNECREVALRAWSALGREPLGVASLDEKFREGRPFCRTGYDFLVVLHMLSHDPAFNFAELEQEQFVCARDALGEEVERFDGLFYGIRRELRDTDFATWSGWQSPIPGMMGRVKRLRERFAAVVVATTKDRESVERLLATAGISLPVIGREATRHKGEQMRALADEHDVAVGSILLVDDLLQNLRMARDAGAMGAMAAWGYNTPAERERAQNEGFPVITKDEFLFRFPEGYERSP